MTAHPSSTSKVHTVMSVKHSSGSVLKSLRFQTAKVLQEDSKPPNQQLYAVRFCDVSPSTYNSFASVGANRASVYSIDQDHNVELLQAFIDEDTEEIFYACTWCVVHDSERQQDSLALCVAGLRGTLKCIDVGEMRIIRILLGHGNSVNDLRTHPVHDSLVFSASKDESIRLWNADTGICVAIFCGEKGHRDEVLCIDVHPAGNCVVSAGMDTSIKIWNLDEPNVRSKIEHSFELPQLSSGSSPFQPAILQFPLFSTTQVHNDYVDSVRWVGNFILSKSTKNRVVLWTADTHRYKGAPLVLREFAILESNLWFVRMDVCIPLDILAVGNRDGRVHVYNLSSSIQRSTKLSRPTNRSPQAIEVLAGREYPDVIDGRGDNSDTSSDESSLAGAKDAKHAAVVVDETFESDAPHRASAVLHHPRSQSTVRQVAFHPMGDYLIYCCDNGTITLWPIAQHTIEKTNRWQGSS